MENQLTKEGKEFVAREIAAVIFWYCNREEFTYELVKKRTKIVHNFIEIEIKNLVDSNCISIIEEIRGGSTNYLLSGRYKVVNLEDLQVRAGLLKWYGGI